ncbi:MAG: hypothetical protein ABR600_07055 [Actinomycetota bacterium]
MAKKRRRRQGARSVPAPTPVAAETMEPTAEPSPNGGSTRASDKGSAAARRDRPPLAGGRLAERMRAPSPFPTLATSVGRGVLAAGTAPVLLTALLYVGALWLGLVALGLEVFPSSLVEALAFPPFGPYLTDIFLPTQIYGLTATALVVSILLTVLRAVVWAVLIGMMLEALQYGRTSLVGVLQGLRAVPAVLVIMLVNVLAIVFSNLVLPVILGPIGQLALAAVLFGGIYLLPFAGAAAVRGPRRAREAIRMSARAARLPGSRHVVLVILYFFVAVLLITLLPGHDIVTANPSLASWAWILGGNVVHLVFLAAVCDRWLVVEDQVPSAPAPRRARRR